MRWSSLLCTDRRQFNKIFNEWLMSFRFFFSLNPKSYYPQVWQKLMTPAVLLQWLKIFSRNQLEKMLFSSIKSFFLGQEFLSMILWTEEQTVFLTKFDENRKWQIRFFIRLMFSMSLFLILKPNGDDDKRNWSQYLTTSFHHCRHQNIDQRLNQGKTDNTKQKSVDNFIRMTTNLIISCGNRW